MSQIIKLVSLVVIFFFSSSFNKVFADEVLYCTEKLTTGFFYEEGKWETTSFNKERFTIKIIGDWESISYDDNVFKCDGDREYRDGYPKICKNEKPYDASAFNIDKYSLRFVFVNPSVAGYALENENLEPDTDNISAGQCEKF